MRLMNREGIDSPFPPNPSVAELKNFNKRKQGGPTIDDFRIDVSGRHLRSPWNRRAAQIFAAEYIKLEDAETKDRRVVEEAFLSHIPGLCGQYKKLLPDYEPDVVAETRNVQANRRRKVSVP